jgi:hypothetical protein
LKNATTSPCSLISLIDCIEITNWDDEEDEFVLDNDASITTEGRLVLLESWMVMELVETVSVYKYN